MGSSYIPHAFSGAPSVHATAETARMRRRMLCSLGLGALGGCGDARANAPSSSSPPFPISPRATSPGHQTSVSSTPPADRRPRGVHTYTTRDRLKHLDVLNLYCCTCARELPRPHLSFIILRRRHYDRPACNLPLLYHLRIDRLGAPEDLPSDVAVTRSLCLTSHGCPMVSARTNFPPR